MGLVGHGYVVNGGNWVIVVKEVVLIPLLVSLGVVALFLQLCVEKYLIASYSYVAV